MPSDVEGEFTLKNVPDGEYEVEISYIGYETYIALNKLDETVVKGYYNTTERLNTGDVTTMKGEDIEKQPVTDPILALEGRVPGLESK